MADHDPLCPWPALSQHPNHCQCDLIARIRADEREQALMVTCATHDAIEDDVREQIARRIEAKSAEGMAKNWAPAAIRAFDIAAHIARGGAR